MELALEIRCVACLVLGDRCNDRLGHRLVTHSSIVSQSRK